MGKSLARSEGCRRTKFKNRKKGKTVWRADFIYAHPRAEGRGRDEMGMSFKVNKTEP